VRFPAPANVFLYRAQIVLVCTALALVILSTAVGIVIVASGGASSVALVGAVLVLAFCAASLCGFVIGGILLRRGATLAMVQTEFLSLVSHELRTPMTSMRMFVEALRDDRLTDPAERERCLSVLHREMGRLEEMVGRLLELSHIETGARAFTMEPVVLHGVLERAVVTLDALELGASDHVTVEVDDGAGASSAVRGDPTALVNVFANLLSNAWKYGEGRPITIAVREPRDGMVETVVCDRGPGVPVEEQSTIFQAFHRGSSARESSVPGSGLGLALVQAIVSRHGGRVEVRCPAGGGTCFHVWLPLAATEEEARVVRS